MAGFLAISVTASESEPIIEELEERIDDLEKIALLEKLLMVTEDETESSQSMQSTEDVSVDSLKIDQKNALDSANNYLEIMPLSYNGLIDQLSYNGYAEEDAKFTADNCGADWEKQVV